MQKIQVLIADDDSLIREGLKIILDMDERFHVVDTVDNGLKAIESCKNKPIDVALLDMRMPVMNGVEAIKYISNSSKVKILVLTTFDEDDYIKEALKYGAKGYILKNNTPDAIKNAIISVYHGSNVIEDVIMEKLKQGFVDTDDNKIDINKFTKREIEVIKYISKGLSNKEISEKLFLSEGTVKNYITNILNKTELKHRTQIAIYYINGKIE
ncbi:response regulator [Haloimpatiens sp. FM7315]|uniref:response regulator transcription factor n=1 Tax=Haloimpatiens sp. FM7315 TaxID=3298609 RepID=UPI0035A2D7F5